MEVYGRKERHANNVSCLRAALRHLEAGGALAVFPAGVVSHWHASQRRVTDPEWNIFAGRLARVAGTRVIPLFFAGRNSVLFQAASCVHPMLRTMLLPREMWRMRGGKVPLFVGRPVDAEVLSALPDDKTRTAYIRACCYALGRETKPTPAQKQIPVAAPGAKELLRNEIRLVGKRSLADAGSFQVFPMRGDAAPHILHEIGRLREETFRAEREGSGNALDIDHFDAHYSHLVLWDKEAETIAGSYRVRVFLPGGPRKTVKNLYTATLFRFDQGFFDRCGLSLELGRAFVARNYQRDYAPLLTL